MMTFMHESVIYIQGCSRRSATRQLELWPWRERIHAILPDWRSPHFDAKLKCGSLSSKKKNCSPSKISSFQRQKRLRFQTRNSTTIWYAPAMASSLMCSCTVTKLSHHFPIASPSETNTEISWRRRGGGPRSNLVVLRSRLHYSTRCSFDEGFVKSVRPVSSHRVSYQEPLRLLQEFDDGDSDPSAHADYYIQLTTSNEEKSTLSTTNSGIILTLISEQGEALVHRILPVKEHGDSTMRFQRGAVDMVHFRGPNLGRIAALWIAPEGGTWRLEQVTVTIMPCAEDQEKATDSKEAKGYFHIFHAHDMLLGDGEDLPAIELKPTQILECNGPDDSALRLDTSLWAPSKTADESEKLREYSMQEYAALKTFLLGSTSAMVGLGTFGLALLGAPDMAQGFAVGGVGGLIYLFLLQRAVDQIPSPQALKQEKVANRQTTPSGLKVKAPAASFALIVGLALVLTRATQASSVVSLPPQALLAGALGFLTSKVAVFLAAFSSPSIKDR